MAFHELHLHLYGCLSAYDVWSLGVSCWQQREERLNRYSEAYEKAWGRRPQWESYWTTPDGFERLRKDYEFKTFANFECFQACFNLIIALFPLSPEDDTVTRYILKKYSHSELRYAEFRIPFGVSFAEDEAGISGFLSKISKAALDTEFECDRRLIPRLAISLAREERAMEFQYRALRNWLQINKELSTAIVAIDFCGYEEKDSLLSKKEFFQMVLEDNKKDPERALAILCHVGETFETFSIQESIERVRSAHRLGAHRLGHCISLGVHTFDENIRALQEDVITELKSNGAVIESCPRSNMWIGNIRNLDHHPFPRFLRSGMNLVLSSDDPGVFDTSYENEENFARNSWNLTEGELMRIRNCAKSASSPILSGRLS